MPLLYAESSTCSCSFCNKVIRNDRIDVMGFMLHRPCAEGMADVLGKVGSFNAWKKAHPKGASAELVA